ncbi:MAG TPA: twin-arginine translocation signal domain-containing protein [Vicinamibacterales bacterium]|jgi:predicted RNA-binding Zn-ribbon protein involved in translation (DUF1610 family)|nr:twin-arginine translocation signal domain-containing protein [Vicinamibacterales bacterium]
MNDEILKKLESKIGRRSFLKGSGLAAATLVGLAAASPVVAFAQDPPQKQDDKKKGDKGDKSDKNQDQDADAKKDSGESTDTETKLDADGREYRVCPQCGSNMYRQGRTWTCENCGYSYVE